MKVDSDRAQPSGPAAAFGEAAAAFFSRSSKALEAFVIVDSKDNGFLIISGRRASAELDACPNVFRPCVTDKVFSALMLQAVRIHRGEESADLNPPGSVECQRSLTYTIFQDQAALTEAECTSLLGISPLKLKIKSCSLKNAEGTEANYFLFSLKDIPPEVAQWCAKVRLSRSDVVLNTDHILLHSEQLIQEKLPARCLPANTRVATCIHGHAV